MALSCQSLLAEVGCDNSRLLGEPAVYHIAMTILLGPSIVLTQRAADGDAHVVEERKHDDQTAPIPDVVFIPTPDDIAEQMLRLAEVRPTDVVYDLGCGDGRIVVTAAKHYGCRAVGCDIDPRRVREARENVRKNRLDNLVEIKHQDLFQTDLSRASVVTLYLTPGYNARLIPRLAALRPGTRVVSHLFAIKGITPDKVIRAKSGQDNHQHIIYLYSTPFVQ